MLFVFLLFSSLSLLSSLHHAINYRSKYHLIRPRASERPLAVSVCGQYKQTSPQHYQACVPRPPASQLDSIQHANHTLHIAYTVYWTFEMVNSRPSTYTTYTFLPPELPKLSRTWYGISYDEGKGEDTTFQQHWVVPHTVFFTSGGTKHILCALCVHEREFTSTSVPIGQ